MGVGRSYIRGPRFAFRQKENLMCCEACVFGRGEHTCQTDPELPLEWPVLSARLKTISGAVEEEDEMLARHGRL
jgi:hypothetical protein